MLNNTRRILSNTLWVCVLGALGLCSAGCGGSGDGGGTTAPPPADTTAPGNVASFLAVPGDGQVSLSWINPQVTDLAGIMVRRATGAAPAVDTGVVVFDGMATSYVDHAVSNDSTYFYSAFSYDNSENFAVGVSNSCTPHVASTVVIPDANLDALVRAQLGIPAGDITDLQMLTMTSLDASSQGIADLEGLQYALNLQSLDLDDNNLTDASNTQLLSQLTLLEELHLADNGMTVLPDLSGLTHLHVLSFEETPISSLGPLSLVPSLTNLEFVNCPVSDLTPLADLVNLEYLYMRQIDATDLDDLAGLTGLQSLTVEFVDISDLTPLSGLTQLTTLGLTGCHATDLTPLAGLSSLTHLGLGNNGIEDLTGLGALSQLESLTLSSNLITDLSPLVGLSHLEYLNLSWNPVRVIPDLSTLTSLATFSAMSCELADIGPLTSLPALTGVDLTDDPLTTEDVQTVIPNLQGQGVTVTFSYDADLVELMGHWSIASIMVDGNPMAPADFFEWEAGTVRNRVVFYPFGHYSAEDFTADDAVTYSEAGTLVVVGNGATLTVTTEDGSAVTPYVPFDGTWARNGADLVLTMDDGASTAVLTWVR